MTKAVDKKHLKLQRKVWYYVRVIPPKYRHGFLDDNGKPITTYKRTTQCTSLEKARIQRQGFDLFIERKFRQLDGDDTPILNDKVQQAILDLKEYRLEEKKPIPSTMKKSEANKISGAIQYMEADAREIVEDEAMKFLPPEVTPEQFKEEAYDEDEWRPEYAFRKLDPSGRASKLYDKVLDQSFDLYVDDYFKYLKDYGSKTKTAKSYVSAIKEFGKIPDAHLMEDIDVEAWALDECIDKGIRPITMKKKMNKLQKYFEYCARTKKVAWANRLNPFHKVKLPQDEGKAIARQIWTMEDMKKLYLTETKHYNWELRFLMLLGMIYGCRLEELCQIKKENIVVQDNIRCIYIAKAKTDIYHKFGRRYLPIVEELQPIIDRIIDKLQPEDYLIAVDKNSPKNEKRSVNLGQRFGNHRVLLGYPRAPKRTFRKGKEEVTTKDFHSYRKTVSTSLKDYNLSPKQVSNICGWNNVIKSEEMAENTYNESMKSHPLSERLKTLEQHVASYTFDLFM
jgi:site-specific recombinase XerD